MKIFVTGASGFLGRFLIKALKDQGHTVISISSKQCDLTKEQSLDRYTSQKFDRIYHLAAWTQAGDFCLIHPAEQWMINQKINTNILCFWQAFQPQAKMICIGTSCSYDPNLPLKESHYLEGFPIESLYTYAMTKRMLLTGLMAMHKQYGLSYLYVIPSTLYGPSYHLDGRQMHFIFDLIRKILRGHLYKEPVVLWGDGNQRRELFHVNDFVNILLTLSDYASNTEINIGSGKEHTIKEFAKKICDIVGYDFGDIQFDETKYVGAKSKVLSIEKLQNILKKYETKPLEEGLEETITWFLENKSALLPL